MRNQYGGQCYRCPEYVAPGDGHFERINGRWRVQHAACAIKFRGQSDPERDAQYLGKMKRNATLTGRKGQRARRVLRDMEGKS